jgi:protein TIF31
MHIIRVRDLIGASGERVDSTFGIQAGASLVDRISTPSGEDEPRSHVDHDELSDYDFDAAVSPKILLPHETPAPKTVKSISLSAWNPPPYHLRNKGHLLYIVIASLEGEQVHITSHVSGFYVNRSSHNKFDPSPKPGPKTSSAHSLLTLLHQIDARFSPAFQQLIEHNSKRDALTLYQLTNAIPANPWLVSSESTSLQEHKPDITRTQESFLLAGADNNENLRDWNEEFQTTRELPIESVPEKIFRERLTSKLFADFNEAAVRGAVLVARGEIAPLNPTEGRDAQIFLHNNVFFSFGADGVGTFATEGGDEAARVATGKDVCGVRAVNQLDIPELFTAATIIVDYLGKRIVGQSIVPGIFKQREPGDSIDYGGVEGKDIIAEKPEFIEPFAALSETIHLKRHPVWDKEGKRHDLEASVDTKGLLGTDGRKYVLDLYRLTPLDVTWLEKYWGETSEERDGNTKKDYPHRMAVLRPELVDSYRLYKLVQRVDEGLAENRKKVAETNGETAPANGHNEDEETSSDEAKEQDSKDTDEDLRRDIYSKFTFSLNPDVFSGQVPQTEEEKEQMVKDEADVRAVCEYLTATIIPRLIQQLQDGDVGFPLDGESLTSLLHKRGINIRYLGTIANLADKDNLRLQGLRKLTIQEIVSRSIKHVAGKYLRQVPHPFASACMSHLLNCLLGSRFNNDPIPETDEALKALYTNVDCGFESLTPEGLQREVVEEARKRYRFDIKDRLVEPGREMQMLREISLKLGLQVVARDYVFEELENGAEENHRAVNGNGNGTTGGKKKKKGKDNSPSRCNQQSQVVVNQSFHADDIVNFVPVVKDASPKVSIYLSNAVTMLTIHSLVLLRRHLMPAVHP